MIANEFLDALPVRQYVLSDGRWRERTVTVDPPVGSVSASAATASPNSRPRRGGRHPRGQPERPSPRLRARARLARQGGVALFVDYGHAATGFGDTLQSVRGHRMFDRSRTLAKPTSPRTSISLRWRGARARRARRSTGRSTRAIFSARSASKRAPARFPSDRRAARREFDAARRRLVGKGAARWARSSRRS